MPERPRELRPAPVLPPPQAPDALSPPPPHAGPRAFPGSLPRFAPGGPPSGPPPPTYPPHGYPHYQQNQYYAPRASGQWYPMGNSPQVSPLGWPPPAQWGYGGWSSAPPPRRSSGLAKVLLGVTATVAGLFFLLVLMGSVARPAVPAQGDLTSHTPAAARNPDATPVNRTRADAVLTANTLYAQGGLANGNCPATDLGRATTEEQTRFYQSLMSCLSSEWRTPIQSAGFRYTEPSLVVFDSPVTTPCGNASPQSGRTLAFYCPTDAVMYADVPQMRRFFGGLDIAYAVVIGHEFGHHVQSETGMLDAYDSVGRANATDRLQLSRRLELQASCMGGLFLGAVADSFPIDSRRLTELQQVAGAFGDEPGSAADERDHGSGESNRRWILAGFDTNDVATCNTFAASSAEVN